MDISLEQTLATLHTAVATELLDRVRSGEARPADISNAIKFLKDNHIDAMPVQGSPLDGLLNSLPFNSEGILDALAH
jgi:hypothetical protein|tara:strand:- start:1114 stop:1344 length:231 start_codon:yes stop_codon:yes gene_type:complete